MVCFSESVWVAHDLLVATVKEQIEVKYDMLERLLRPDILLNNTDQIKPSPETSL